MFDVSTNTAKPAKSAAQSGTWVALSRVNAQAVQFVIFLVGARMMSPADFGVFALVSSVSVLLSVIAVAGWAESIMTLHEGSNHPRQIMSIAIVSGIAFSVAGFLLSFASTAVSSEAEVRPLMQLFSLTIFFGAFGGAIGGLLNYRNRLIAAAILALVSDLVNLVVSILSLLRGDGVFALVYGRLASGVCLVVIGLLVARTLPALRIERKVLRSAASYSVNILAVRFLSQLRMYAAVFIVGGFLGAAAVGQFRAAQRLVGALAEVIGEPTRMLAWALFRKSRTDHDGATVGFPALARRFFSVMLILAIPVFLVLASVSRDLIVGLIGPNWIPAAAVVGPLALANLILTFGYAAEPILSLSGSVRVLPPLVFFQAIVGAIATAVAAPFGIEAIAWAQVASAVLVTGGNALAFRRHAGIHLESVLWPLRFVVPSALFGLLAGLACAQIEFVTGWHPIMRVLLISAVAFTVYFISLLAMDERFRLELRRFPLWKQ